MHWFPILRSLQEPVPFHADHQYSGDVQSAKKEQFALVELEEVQELRGFHSLVDQHGNVRSLLNEAF